MDAETHAERTPCRSKGRDWGDAYTSQETPMIARKSPKTCDFSERHGVDLP